MTRSAAWKDSGQVFAAAEEEEGTKEEGDDDGEE